MTYPYMRVVVYFDNSRDTYASRSKKSFFSYLLRLKIFKKVDIVVKYNHDFLNEGTYVNKEDLIEAYRFFTEQELIKDICS